MLWLFIHQRLFFDHQLLFRPGFWNPLVGLFFRVVVLNSSLFVPSLNGWWRVFIFHLAHHKSLVSWRWNCGFLFLLLLLTFLKLLLEYLALCFNSLLLLVLQQLHLESAIRRTSMPSSGFSIILLVINFKPILALRNRFKVSNFSFALFVHYPVIF